MQHLHIEQRENEEIVVLDLRGRLVLGPEDTQFREHLMQLLESEIRRLILNFKEVHHIDTGGFGSLVYVATRFREVDGRVALLNLSESHTKVQDLLKINTLFEVYHHELDAVNSFFPDRAVTHYDILSFVEHQHKDGQEN